jgi:hypothetical protein
MSKKRQAKVEKELTDNKSLVSLRMRQIADEYDALLMANDHLIRENRLLEKEVQILLKELDFENTDSLRRIIRAKAILR